MTYTSSWELYRARSLYIDDGQAISKYKKKKTKKKTGGGEKKAVSIRPRRSRGCNPLMLRNPSLSYTGGDEKYLFFFYWIKKNKK